MHTKERAILFIISILATLLAVRVFLSFFPSTNLDVGGYNIHHLFVGALLSIALMALIIVNIVNKIVIILAGISSALVLDEIVYLIATDGSDLSYLAPLSLGGAIVLASIILLITAVGYYASKQEVRQ